MLDTTKWLITQQVGMTHKPHPCIDLMCKKSVNVNNRIFYHFMESKQYKMNDQVLKTIRLSMCPKDKWIPDKDVTNCFNCDSRFNKLYRWKHHCRICGRIFCSPCCEFYLVGADLGEQDRPMRTCEFCNRKFWSYIIEKDLCYYQKYKNVLSIASFDNKLSESTLATKGDCKQLQSKRSSRATEIQKMKQIKALVTDFQVQVDPIPMTKLYQTAESKLSIIIQIVLKMNRIPFSFYDWLQKIARMVVLDIPANAMVTSNMDICKHIKFKSEKQDEVNARYVIGTMIKKSIHSKRMPKSFENANVLLLYGNIEAADIVGVRPNSFISFEDMIDNRKKETAKLIEKLKVMDVKLVFLEGSIDKEAQDMMFSSDIAVISKVGALILVRLRISLQINKIVEGISYIDPTRKMEYVGRSKLVYFTKIKNFQNEEQTCMIVEGNKAQNGMTVIMGGPDKTVLKSVKYEFKQLLRIARHLVLKIYKLLLDQDMMMSMSSEQRASLTNTNQPNLFFSSNLQAQATVVAYLRHRYLVYKRIVFVESDYSPQTLPEVNKQMVEQYLRKKDRTFKRKWNNFTQICEMANESRRVYSTDDMPLGEYLLRKLLSINNKCENCRKPFYQHIEVFYWQHLYAKVEVQSRIVDKQNTDDNNQGFSCEQMFEELSKIKDKQKIQSYLECSQCHMQLTDKFTLRQEHLQLSYVAFIGHIFHSTHITHLKYPKQPQNDVCQHHKKSRIFQLGSLFVKIYTGFLILSPECKFSNQDISNHIRKKQSNIYKELAVVFGVNLEYISSYIRGEIQKMASSTKNPNMSSIIRNPRESFLRVTSHFRSMGKDTKLTKAEYIEVLIPQIMEYLGRISLISMTIFSSEQSKGFLEIWREYSSMVYLLNRIITILGLLGKSSSKHDSHKIYKQSFDSSLMDDIDINAQFFQDKTLESESSPSPQAKDVESPPSASDIWASNTRRRPTNFPSLISSKLRQTMSLTPQNPKVIKQTIDSIIKGTLGNFNYEAIHVRNIPCNTSSQSLISNALNSGSHKEAMRRHLGDVTVKLVKCDYEIISTNEEINKINNVLDAHERGLESPPTIRKRHSPQVFYEICIFYPKEFEAIRCSKQITMESYINSIIGTDVACTMDNKQGNYCLKSFNDVICMKFVSEKEFQSIIKFLPQYFEHVRQPTMLTPIFGVYQIIKNCRSQYVIIMQNPYFGMNQWIVYDLKGTHWKRFSKYPNAPLDVNYLIDRNSEPLFSSTDVILYLKRTVDFLAQCNFLNYSLSLIISIDDPNEEYLDGSRIKVMIMNFVREYSGSTADKFSKNVISLSNTNTASEAKNYAQKLLKGVRRYFWTIPS